MPNGAARIDFYKRLFLRLFIVSIVVAAVVGASVMMVDGGGWLGWLQVKVLLTTSVIAAASVCGLACGGCLALGHRVLPTAGLVLATISAVLCLIGLWSELGDGGYWKAVGASASLGIGCSHLSMLLLLKLKRSYRWLQLTAYYVILGLATLIAFLFLFEIDDLEHFRIVGVLSVAAGAITLIMPVLAYLSRDAAELLGEEGIARIEGRIAKLKQELAELEGARAQLVQRAQDADPARPN